MTDFTVSASSDIPESLEADLNKSGDLIISENNDKKEEKSTAERILDRIIGEREEDANQGEEEFCSITPNNTSYITWSDTPEFVWRGNLAKIQVLYYGSEGETITMWNYTLTTDDNIKGSVSYNADGKAKPLERGTEYYYLIMPGETAEQEDIEVIQDEKSLEFTFKLMENNDYYNKIIEELKLIEEEPFDELDDPELINITPEEKRAIQRALFFKEQKIGEEKSFLDFIRELFSVQLESPEFTNFIHKLRTEFCTKSEN